MGLIFVDADNVLRAIEQWSPGPCFDEKQCRDSLYMHLVGVKALRRKTFHLEHPVGNGFADIFVDLDDSADFGTKVAIELKYNLKTKAECDRLVGQIANYVDVGQVVIVLCGIVSQRYLAVITRRVEEFTSNKFFAKGRIIVKPVTPRSTDGRFLSGRGEDRGSSYGSRDST